MKRQSSRVNAINKKLREVADFFGTESAEYSELKAIYEKSFNTIPVKIKDKVHYNNYDFSTITFTVDGYYQIDTSAVPKDGAYNTIFENIYKSFNKKGTVLNMAQSYRIKNPITGRINVIRTMKQAIEHKETIQRLTKFRYEFMKTEDNMIYIGSEKTGGEPSGLFADIQDESVKERIRDEFKKRAGTHGLRAELLYERAVNMIAEQLMLEMLNSSKENDASKSSKNDYSEPYTAESVMEALTIRTSRKSK